MPRRPLNSSAWVRVPGHASLPARLLEDLVVQEVALGAEVQRPLEVMVNRVAAVDRPRIFLARDENVTVPLEAARRAPRRLPEVRAGHVAHLQQVGDVHVLGRHLRPGVVVADRIPLDVNVGVAGIPAARRLVDIALQGDRDGAGLVGPDLDPSMMEPILDAAADDDLVRPGGHASLVAPVHVEHLPVGRRPERAGGSRQSPDLVGIAVHEDCIVRRQGHPSGRIVETDAGGHGTARGGVGDLQANLAERRRRLGGAATDYRHVAYAQSVTATDGDIDPAGAVARQSRPVESQRDAPQGFSRFRPDLDPAPAVAAIPIPDDGERRREGRRVGQGQGHRLVDVEGVFVLDVEANQPARDALPAAHRTRLDRVAVGARTQLRIAQPVGVRDARRGPVDLYYVAGLGPVGSHAGGRRQQRDDREPKRARGQDATKRRFHLRLPSSPVTRSGVDAHGWMQRARDQPRESILAESRVAIRIAHRSLHFPPAARAGGMGSPTSTTHLAVCIVSSARTRSTPSSGAAGRATHWPTGTSRTTSSRRRCATARRTDCTGGRSMPPPAPSEDTVLLARLLVVHHRGVPGQLRFARRVHLRGSRRERPDRRAPLAGPRRGSRRLRTRPGRLCARTARPRHASASANVWVRCGIPASSMKPLFFLDESGEDGPVVRISMCNRRLDCVGPDPMAVSGRPDSSLRMTASCSASPTPRRRPVAPRSVRPRAPDSPAKREP